MDASGSKQVIVDCGGCRMSVVVTPITFGYGKIAYCPLCRHVIHDYVIKNGEPFKK